MPVYNLATVRKMLSAAFSTGEINTLAFDLFPSLYGDFASGMSKSDRIQQIVMEADRNGRIPHLITYVQNENSFQYHNFKAQLIQEDPMPAPQHSGWQQRKVDLERHIQADLQLLAEYEDALRHEDEPRRRHRYQGEIDRQKESLTNYRQQLDDLQSEIEQGAPDTVTNQQLLDEIKSIKSQMSGMEQRLSTGQQAILQQIDQRHRHTLSTVLSRLDDNQTELVSLLLTAAERQQIDREETVRLVDGVTAVLTQLQTHPNAAQWQQLLDAVNEPASLQQKLKLILPIIPGILEYETEFAVDGLDQLKQSWRTLTARFRS